MSLGTFGPLGRIVHWYVLSLGTFCLRTFCLCTGVVGEYGLSNVLVYRLCVGIVVCWVMVWGRGVKGVIAGGLRTLEEMWQVFFRTAERRSAKGCIL